MLRIENCTVANTDDQGISIDVTTCITNLTTKTLRYMQLSHRLAGQAGAFTADRGGDEALIAVALNETFAHRFDVHLNAPFMQESQNIYTCNAVVCSRERIELTDQQITDPEHWSIVQPIECISSVLGKHLLFTASINRRYGGRYNLDWKLSFLNNSKTYIPKVRIHTSLFDSDLATLATDESNWEIKPFSNQLIDHGFGDLTLGQLRHSRLVMELLVFVPEAFLEASTPIQISR